MHSDPVMNIRRAAVLCLVLLFICQVPQGNGYSAETGRSVPGEYEVKAAFVYNFIKFVEWPSRGQGREDTIQLCVLGEVPVPEPFIDLDGQEIMGKKLVVSMLREPQDARPCQVLFVAPSLSRRMAEVLEAVRGRPTLTVGDTEGFARLGIMINMYLENKRVRFEINAETARAAGLRVSTKLMRLAGAVHGGTRTGE
jgi:hypothetical protein